ncbi:hypothetical protein FQR65_LT01040 [Abscondita terminalis]|nr:hypothetical protein FQR65_LT01040 [Abscondita terminalis]
MISFLIIAVLFAIAEAQRPGYIQGPTYPQLANRFKTDNDDATTAVNVVNRLGEIDGTTKKIPVDARGDSELVDRVNTWPRENRPFWLINAEHIEKHRNPQGNPQVPQVQGTRPRTAPQPINIQSRFNDPDYQDYQLFINDYFRPRQRFNSFESDEDVIPRTIRPVQTRGSFAGPL